MDDETKKRRLPPHPIHIPTDEEAATEAATARLLDLLTSDIYTDAPEYADRVAEIHELIPLVFKKRT